MRRVVLSLSSGQEAELVHLRDHHPKAYVREQAAARAAPGCTVFLYQDELTYYRHPTVAQGYALQGSTQPYARQGYGYNRMRRIAACLDVQTGRLLAWQRAHFDVRTLVRYFHSV